MVGIFTGSGSGLERGSANVLGGSGLLGSAAFGRSGEQLLLNAATGNLLVTQSDEFLVGRGPDAAIGRTYNSLGNATDDNGDNWRQSTDRGIFGLTGTVNTSGSTVTRRSPDGSEIVYTWNATASAYVATEGAGAYDTLTYASGTNRWTWTDGDSHTTETYEVSFGSASQWRIKEVADASAVTMSFAYVASSDRLDKVTTADGGYIQYGWSGNNITQVVTHYTDLATSTAKTLTRVRYAYDGSNRLTSVTTDLTPDDNSVIDGSVHTATYTYDGSSTRVATIAESDGSSIAIGYDATSHKVISITQTVASGVTRVTGIAYISSTVTTITDPLGQVTTLEYNADGSLKKITAPPAVTGATAQTVQFTYDSDGNVLTVTDPAGQVTTYGGYANGNWTTQTDPLGNVVSRIYDAANNLLNETRYGIESPSNSAPHTTRFAYDSANRLAWTLSPLGVATRYDYDSYGQLIRTTEINSSLYPAGTTPTTVFTAAQIDTWAAGLGNKNLRNIAEMSRDARGGLTGTTTYATADSAGNATTSAGYTANSAVYDQTGKLLARSVAGTTTEHFVYDGLGRMTASTDVNGGTTSFVFTESTADNSTKTVITTAAGYVQTYTYSRAGDLISMTDSGTGVTGGTTTYQYDALGRVRVATDANTNKTYTLYDHAGRKTADIDSFGFVREYRYDADNRVVATVRWTNAISGTNLTTLANPANTLEIATIRPSAHTGDIWNWTVYDADGRTVQTIEGDGSVTSYEYDASGQLVKTLVYGNTLTSAQLATIRATAPAAALTPTASGNDSFSRTGYTRDGILLGTLDFAGYVTHYFGNGGGKIGTVATYETKPSSTAAATGTWTDIFTGLVSTNASAIDYDVYDGEGRVRFALDRNGGVTEYDYNDGLVEVNSVRRTVRYAGTITVSGAYTVDNVQAALTAAGLTSSPDNRIAYTVYDAAGRAAYAIDPSGAVTGFGYDNSGRLIKTVEFATLRSTSSLPDYTTMVSWATYNAGSSDRVSRTYYTARGEVAYTVDGEGYVVGKAHDAKGQLVTEQRWDTPVSATDSWTLANVTAALSGSSSTTSYTYDPEGRVATMRDGAGHGHDYTYTGNGLLAWDIRMSGSSTDESRAKFVYDAAGRLTDRYDGWTSTSTATHYAYDGRGNQVSVTDPNGKTLTRTFDGNGRPLTETDPTGGVTTYQYNSLGEVLKTTDARGNSSYNYYDALDRLVATRDAENYVTTMTYTAFNQIATVTRHSARATNTAAVGTLPTWTWDGTDVPLTTTYEYDKLGNVAKVTDPLTNYSQITYNAFGEQSVIRDERGMLASEAYDKNGLLKTQIVDTAGKAITTGYTYNARGQVLTATDANGKVTTSTYDLAGRLATVKDALNNVTTYTYDGRDNLVAVTDALGKVTRTIYDANDRTVATIDALGGVTTYDYDADGHLVTQLEYKTRVSTGSMALQVAMSTLTPLLSTGADDRTTRYAYDDDGRLRFTVDARLHVVELEYDAAGNVVRTTAYDGAIAGTSFTTSGIATQVAALAGSPRTTRAIYDALGRTTYAIDALGHVSWSVRDAMGNIVKQVEYAVAYTSSGNPTLAAMTAWQATSSVTAGAANDRTTRAWYDANGRLAYSLDALGFVSRYEYDAGGNVIKKTCYTEACSASDATTAADLASFYTAPASPQVTQFTYDTAGRLTETLDAEGFKIRLVLSQTGQVTSSTTAADTADAHVVTYTYDDVGRVATETVRIGTSPSGSDLVTTYTYDAVGHTVKVHDPRGNDTYSYYDALGQQVAVRDAESYVTETAYSTFGDVTSVTRHSASATNTASTTMPTWTWATTDVPATTLFEYNTLGQLTKSTDAMGADEQYTLGNFGERLSVRNKLGGTTSYTYDKNGRVLTETLPSSIAVNRYEYDADGNRTKMVEADGAAEMRTTRYTYDKRDQLTTTTGDSVTVLSSTLVASSYTPTQTLIYDSRGNVIQSVDADAGAYFYYDRNDRLIAQISPIGTLSTFTYDGNGNRVSEKIFGTAVSLPGTPGGTPPTGSGTVRETRYAYDRANRLVSTAIPGLQTGEYTGGAWVFTTGDIVTRREYDAAGNVLRQYDGRDSLTRHYYDALGREIAQVDAERYLTVWDRDAEGNVVKETRYATALGGGTDIETASIAAMQTAGGTTGNRVTDFTYDKNGRRLTETRESVAYVAVDSGGTVTSGTASSTITYTYDGLGHVLTKVEANGDTTTYAYDMIGRLTLETGQAFTDYLGTTTAPRTAYTYDGLNNLKSTRVQAGSSASETNDRVTTYVYGGGGRLEKMLSAEGYAALAAITSPTTTQIQDIWAKYGHFYSYDKAGRTVLDRYDRVKSDASSVTEAKVTLYDIAGRATTQTMARLSGTTWLFTSELSGNPAYDAVNMAYDAFGDLTDRGISSAGATVAYQEHFYYDAGGRLWKSNTGDGVLRFHLYDEAGNETLTLTSTGADLSSLTGLSTANIGTTGDYSASTTGAVTTVSVYDKRGQAVATREPDREVGGTTATVTRAKTYNAFGEVLSETDARGYTTSFTYNSMGRMLSKVSPQVSVTSETGVQTNVNPTETYSYDLSGRLDKVTDANGNVTKRALLAGTGHGDSEALVTREFHADTGVFETKYDVFGDARSLVNELGDAETRTYDKMARLDSATHRGGHLVDHYSYDLLGQRTRHWITESGTSTIASIGSYFETTDYDAQGRVVLTVAMGGDATTTAYAWIATTATTGMAAYGGWTKTTVNAAGKTMTEKQDYFGRTVDKVDFGGNDYAFTFDLGARLTLRTNNTGENLAYAWYNTGLIASVTSTLSGDTYYGQTVTSSYAYDASGNRTLEKYEATGHNYDWETGTPISYTITHQNAVATWDALGRMVSITDTSGISGSAPMTTAYEYDAQGNVRRTLATYRELDGQGVVQSTTLTVDNWYLYDSMNRFVVTQGGLSATGGLTGDAARGQAGAAIGITSGGMAISYDLAGQRKTKTEYLTGLTKDAWYYVPDHGPGRWYNTIQDFSTGSGSWVPYTYSANRTETYTYTEDGYLDTVYVDTDKARISQTGVVTVNPMDGTNGLVVADTTSDALGRTTDLKQYVLDAGLVYERAATYNAKNQLTQDVVTTRRGSDTYVATTSYYYNASSAGSGLWDGVTTGGSYMGGAVTRTSTVNVKNGSDSAAADTSMVYRLSWRDATVTAKSTYDGDTGTSSNTLWTSDFYYDPTGSITSVHIQDGRSRTVSFITDGNGLILQRDENDTNTSTGDPRELHYYFNGIRIGAISNNGTGDVDYATSIEAQISAPAYGPFRGGAATGAFHVDFDQSYSPINGLNQSSTAARYTVQAGDTLAGIALQMWGDAGFWYLIADANGLTGSEALTPGTSLSIPNKVANSRNTSTTFRPYDPNEALGDVSPTTAKAPKKGGCGVFGQILAAVVAEAVAALVSMIPVVGPVLAPYAANIAHQAVLIATHDQDRFDWNSVGIVAVDQFMPFKTGNPFIDNAITQKVSMKLGLQEKFSWAGVATAGITAGLNMIAGNAFPPGTSRILQSVATNSAALIASSAATSLITGEDFGDTILAALPSVVGQTVGQLASSGIERAFHWAKDELGAAKADYAADAAKMHGLTEKVGGWAGGIPIDELAASLVPASPIMRHSALGAPASVEFGSDQTSAAAATKQGIVVLLGHPKQGNDPAGALGSAANTGSGLASVTQAVDGDPPFWAPANNWVKVGDYSVLKLTTRSALIVDGQSVPDENSPLGTMTIVTRNPDNFEMRWITRGDKPLLQTRVKNQSTIDENLIEHRFNTITTMDPTQGMTYAFQDNPIAPFGGVYTTISFQAATLENGDWRAWGGELQSLRNRWLDLDRENPGLVDAVFRREDMERAVVDRRIDAWVSQIELEWDIVGGALLIGGSLAAPGVSTGVGLVEQALPRFFSRTIVPAGNAGVRMASRVAAENIPGRVTTLIERVDNPNPLTGAGYGVNNPPVRIAGEWSDSDMYNALYGRSPQGLGRPHLHHADQMPGSGIHEVLEADHLGNGALHPNKWNQGVTPAMRTQDSKLHWWYRAQEQGASSIYPNHIYD